MTRAEAIEIIKREFTMDEDVEELYPEVVEARDMAISALEHTWRGKAVKMMYCGDAISREDVMDWLENATYEDVCEAIGTNLDFLPSVTHKSGKCKDCMYWQDNNNGYPHPYCHWNSAETPDADDFCSGFEPQESDHKCHTCKHYTSGERDGSCGSYICKHYSDWESEDKE